MNELQFKKNEIENNGPLVVEADRFYFAINEDGMLIGSNNKKFGLGQFAVKWRHLPELINELVQMNDCYNDEVKNERKGTGRNEKSAIA